MHYLGPTVALFSVDMRTQRTRSVCVPEVGIEFLGRGPELPSSQAHAVGSALLTRSVLQWGCLPGSPGVACPSFAIR